MKKNVGDNFSTTEMYKLYRTVYELFHPAISKKNISNYKVVLDEKLLPILVFYPEKISNAKSIIIYVPGNGKVNGMFGKYRDIGKEMAKETNRLVIMIDYFGSNLKFPTVSNKVFKVISYLYEEFINNGINMDDVCLMGDSTGCMIIKDILDKLKKKSKIFKKEVFLFPVVQNSYDNYSWNEMYINLNLNLEKKLTNYLKKYYAKGGAANWYDVKECVGDNLVITGDMDLLKDDGVKLAELLESRYTNIKFASHNVLGFGEEERTKEIYKKVNDFLLIREGE